MPKDNEILADSEATPGYDDTHTNTNGATPPAQEQEQGVRMLPRYREAVLAIIGAIEDCPSEARDIFFESIQELTAVLRPVNKDTASMTSKIMFALNNLSFAIPPK